MWFANGIHHHYSNDKFVPEFTEGYLLDVIETIPEEKFGDLNPLRGEVCKAIFDPALYKTRLNQTAGEDLIATSSNNYYEGVTQAEVEKFYADMVDHNDPEPISYGLNSKLVKENGVLKERVWKVGGMYSPAIEKIVYWLEKAQAVAAAKKGAQVLMFGVGPQEAHFEMNTYDIYKKQLTIQGSFINPLTFKDAISLLESGKMNVAPLISHELGLEEVQDFLDGKIQGVSKAVVKVGE